MTELKNRTVGRVLDKSYDALSRMFTIKVQIPEWFTITEYLRQKLEEKKENSLVFIAPIGEADENNREYISDYVNLYSDGYIFPGCQITNPLMLVFAEPTKDEINLDEEERISEIKDEKTESGIGQNEEGFEGSKK